MARAAQWVYPAVQYRNGRKAIAWLGEAFGFEPLLVVPGASDDSVGHAELRLGRAVIMLNSADEGQLHEMLAPGGEPPRQSLYVVIEDPDAHYARAKAAGARVILDLRNEDYGSRGYTALDLEGNVWSFGTYRPELPD